jgi:hypothetical protein
MAMIDIDEFLVPHQHESLPDLLALYEEFGGLAINWQVFGPSGHQTRPKGLQIACFTKKMPVKLDSNRYVKTIVQTDKVMFWGHVHYPRFKAGHWSVNERGDRVDRECSPVSVETVQINHYYTRSREDWPLKLKRGRASAPPDAEQRNPAVLDWFDREAVVEDTSIERFIPRLEAVLGRTRGGLPSPAGPRNQPGAAS